MGGNKKDNLKLTEKTQYREKYEFTFDFHKKLLEKENTCFFEFQNSMKEEFSKVFKGKNFEKEWEKYSLLCEDYEVMGIMLAEKREILAVKEIIEKVFSLLSLEVSAEDVAAKLEKKELDIDKQVKILEKKMEEYLITLSEKKKSFAVKIRKCFSKIMEISMYNKIYEFTLRNRELGQFIVDVGEIKKLEIIVKNIK